MVTYVKFDCKRMEKHGRETRMGGPTYVKKGEEGNERITKEIGESRGRKIRKKEGRGENKGIGREMKRRRGKKWEKSTKLCCWMDREEKKENVDDRREEK